MKVLIDTCVVVDFLQQRQPFAESALKVFMLAGSGEIMDILLQNLLPIFIT